jgi:hypothetical protein
VIKSTLGALNITLADVTHNDKLVKQGLVDIQTYLDSLSSETAGKLTIFEAKFMTEKHITQVNNALILLQRNVDVIGECPSHSSREGTAAASASHIAVRISMGEPGILPTGHYPAFCTKHRLGKPCV